MGYKNRYIFIKRTYPNTIIIFEKNNTYKSYGKDKELLNYLIIKNKNDLNKLNINYIVIRNMEILEHKIFDDNMYRMYMTRFNLYKLIEYIHQKKY